MANNELTAAERIALAKRLGAEAIAETDPERVTGGAAVADFLLRAAKSRNHALGLERLTADEGAGSGVRQRNLHVWNGCIGGIYQGSHQRTGHNLSIRGGRQQSQGGKDGQDREDPASHPWVSELATDCPSSNGNSIRHNSPFAAHRAKFLVPTTHGCDYRVKLHAAVFLVTAPLQPGRRSAPSLLTRNSSMESFISAFPGQRK